MHRVNACVLVVGLVGACGDDAPTAAGAAGSSGTTPDADEGESDRGDNAEPVFSVSYDDTTETITLAADGDALLRLDGDAFQIGVTETVDDGLNYNMVHGLDVQWQSPEALALDAASGDGVALGMEYPGGIVMRVSIVEDATGRFSATWRGPSRAARRLSRTDSVHGSTLERGCTASGSTSTPRTIAGASALCRSNRI